MFLFLKKIEHILIRAIVNLHVKYRNTFFGRILINPLFTEIRDNDENDNTNKKTD